VLEDTLEGVNGIMHVASPAGLSYDGADGELFTLRLEQFYLSPLSATIQPAVRGTLNILRSAQSHASISRVVICSSDVAIHPPPDNIDIPTTYSEEDWNELSPGIVKEHGDETDFQNIYSASKVLADKGTLLPGINADHDLTNQTATWKFYEENQDKLTFDLVTLHPTIVRWNVPSPCCSTYTVPDPWSM
jgi:hypothetical protein